MDGHKHTPLPWSCRGDDGKFASHDDEFGEWGHYLESPDHDDGFDTAGIAIRGGGKVVAMAVHASERMRGPTPAELVANAELIVRAVNSHADLLAACEAALTGGSAAKWEATREQIRKAVAKAKGEPNGA